MTKNGLPRKTAPACVLPAWAALLLGLYASPALGQVASYNLGGASVIRPAASPSVDAFPFFSVFAPPALNLGFPQPLGHQIISTGPNGYVYRPVTDLAAFVDRALVALRSADYERVLVELDPVVTEAADDGRAWMIRAQALFGLANYGKAAESLHMALRLLPRGEWGRPVVRQRDYFRSPEEYAARLRDLEAYVRGHSHEGAGHFLLGYHYGYLGRMPEADRELRTALRLMTGDDGLANALVNPANQAAAPLDDRPRPGLLSDEDAPPRARVPREF